VKNLAREPKSAAEGSVGTIYDVKWRLYSTTWTYGQDWACGIEMSNKTVEKRAVNTCLHDINKHSNQ